MGNGILRPVLGMHAVRSFNEGSCKIRNSSLVIVLASPCLLAIEQEMLVGFETPWHAYIALLMELLILENAEGMCL